ncbi:type VI secretion system tip protein TssI/VgrG [Trinickia diaoshuihuensis]|uniref:type VI secretion system tip protein TssI/VgrG n=1 Tax=Trinickia diaoshuihuensis TaxID=2292265 RepID=UPI000E280250|nr:type VI secretion system tip protein TssI/VgrG [Trinickia diaoshuihuensis]
MPQVTTVQSGSFLSVTTPFGEDVLLLEGFSGREAISEPFHFELRMRSTNPALSAASIVGKSATVTIQTHGGTPRYFNGIVTRFAQVGADAAYGYYSAALAPRLWLATLGSDRVIYQNMTVLDIVEKALSGLGITVKKNTTGDYAAREYCVQYDESPFHFVSRLMEEEGIFYFFTFANGSHTMVLADSPSAHEATPNAGKLWFSGDSVAHSPAERVSSFELVTGLTERTHIVADYDFTSAAVSTATSSSRSGTTNGTRYTFPGRYAQAKDSSRTADLRLAAQQVGQQTGRGTSACFALTAGSSFTLGGHANGAVNANYVVRAVEHSATNDQYTNEFVVFPSSVPFRPPLVTPRPVVAGNHTATVSGSSGEELWTDAYGRIKVKFHWDRSWTEHENTSCWVRVAQTVAGNGWGHFFLPRVGQEVIVSYVDGDPDRPLVTGCVYNKSSTLPYEMPSMQTRSTIMSRSSKNGEAGNEIRMEDKTGSEELYLHAQKDMNLSIENALATTVIAGNETHTVQKGDRVVDVQTGKETHTVKGTRLLDVTGDETHRNHAKFTHDVTGDYTLKVSGNLTIDVSGSITFKSGTSFSAKAGTSLSNEAGTTLANKAGTTLTIEGLEVQGKASATASVDGGGMLALKGGIVKLN